uniref:hypothetical protein n=1 Tax=Amycolatopsis sp. CA-151526 TaxID=3239921 RepID=UPI003F49AF32
MLAPVTVSPDLDAVLTRIATVAIDDHAAAQQLLIDWAGPTRTDAGEPKIRAAARTLPRLIATAIGRSGRHSPAAMWCLRSGTHHAEPPAMVVALQATICHLNGEPDTR